MDATDSHTRRFRPLRHGRFTLRPLPHQGHHVVRPEEQGRDRRRLRGSGSHHAIYGSDSGTGTAAEFCHARAGTRPIQGSFAKGGGFHPKRTAGARAGNSHVYNACQYTGGAARGREEKVRLL